MNLQFDFSTRLDQNNRESEKIICDHHHKFNGQCDTVYQLLLQGHRLTVIGVANSHKIGDLRARLHTIRRAGVNVKDEIKEGGYKEYFL